MKIKELLATPEQWTKKTLARDSLGNIQRPNSPTATCWCITGAVFKCYPKDTDQVAVLSKIHATVVNAIRFNDAADTTFEMVRRVIEELDV